MKEAWLAVFSFGIALTAVAQPRIESIDPSQGPITGGTVVTIRGSSFTGAEVTMDRKPLAPLSQSATELRLRMPAHDNGYALIAVGDAHVRFLYFPPALRDLPAGFITTVAGIGGYVGEYGRAVEAAIRPWGVAIDRSGLVYFTDAEHNRVFRVRDGILETVFGTGFNPFGPGSHDGPAIDTAVSFPRGIAFDSRGNLIVPDTSDHLWRVRPDGIAEIVAGTGHAGYSGDGGPAIQAAIWHPSYVAVDPGDNVYFIDWTNARVRKIDPGGNISTYIGTGVYGFSGDGGPATQAQFNLAFPDLGGLAIDRDGNLLLLDYNNKRIRRVNRATGIITTVVSEGPGGQPLNDMRSIAVSPANEIYFSNAATTYRRNVDGTIVLMTGSTTGFVEDGALFSSARIGSNGMAFDAAGTLYYADNTVARLRKVDETGRIRTIAGNGPAYLGEGGPAVAAAMMTPYIFVDVLPTGELAIANQDRAWKIDHDGHLIRFAGTGLPSPIEDAPASAATLNPFSIFVNGDGSIDLAQGNLPSVQIRTDGIVHRTAGKSSNCDFSGDGGDARAAGFCQVWDAIRDDSGNLFLADANNNRVRRVDAKRGVVSTIAGSGAVNGLERYGAGTTCGDGGPALNACINTPWALAFDDAGNLYVSENAARVRRIDRSGVITTLAEVGTSKLAWAFGNLFSVAGDAILRISPAGTVTRLNATGIGFSGDGGPVAAAHIFANKQQGVAFDAEGNLFFGDSDNLRVRAIRYGAVLAPPGATVTATANGPIRATVLDAAGRRAAGVRVDFAVPANGPSCTLTMPFAITDANGEASVSCTTNCIEGSYVVTATPLTAATSAKVTMTNHKGDCNRRRAIRH